MLIYKEKKAFFLNANRFFNRFFNQGLRPKGRGTPPRFACSCSPTLRAAPPPPYVEAHSGEMKSNEKTRQKPGNLRFPHPAGGSLSLLYRGPFGQMDKAGTNRNLVRNNVTEKVKEKTFTKTKINSHTATRGYRLMCSSTRSGEAKNASPDAGNHAASGLKALAPLTGAASPSGSLLIGRNVLHKTDGERLGGVF